MASAACIERPAVTSDYTPKGKYETIGGIKTYIIGPESATRAIIDVYDVFGIAPQTLQGADMLATMLNCLVLVPDWFDYYPEHDWFPANTDEKKAHVQKFWAEQADIPKNVAKLIEYRKVVGEKYPAVGDHWGVFGLCWGGKIAVLATGEGNEGANRKFQVSGTAHPGRLDAADAEPLNVPHILLASPGEPADVVAKIKEILEQPGKTGLVETYDTMFHGWMGARANLGDEKNRNEFQRGYGAVADFFGAHL